MGISGQDIRRRIRRWLVSQHWVRWRSLGNTQRQARELISGPCLGAQARILSFNRTQSRDVTGLLTGHNTVRRHFHLMVLSDSPLCRRCGVEDETSAHTLGECEALVSLRHVYLGSFYLEPEDINRLTPNDLYKCRTAPLTSKRCILYIYSTNVGTEYFKHAQYSPFFSLQNAVCFIMLTCLVPVLFTFDIQDLLKLKKNISGAKGLRVKVWGLSGTLAKQQGNRASMNRYGAQTDRQIRPRYIGTVKSQTQS